VTADPAPCSLDLLEHGSLELEGRMLTASNATFVGEVELDGVTAGCVYKPVRGERPLWDFPDGTLANRERAAYLVSLATGTPQVPPTVLRDGPFGPGMCQLWIDEDPEAELVDVLPAGPTPQGWLHVLDAEDHRRRPVALVHRDDPGLQLMAAFDAIINNADRKGGHVLVDRDGRLYGVDHGVSFHHEPKLRTVLWGWAGKALPPACLEAARNVGEALRGDLRAQLARLLSPAEIRALSRRVDRLIDAGVFPEPSGHWPTVPWPAF
jgi:uncharacterized repeat protein (TIGR03843 family)